MTAHSQENTQKKAWENPIYVPGWPLVQSEPSTNQAKNQKQQSKAYRRRRIQFPELTLASNVRCLAKPVPETLVPRVSTDLSRVLGRGRADTSCGDSAPSRLPPYHPSSPNTHLPLLPSPPQGHSLDFSPHPHPCSFTKVSVGAVKAGWYLGIGISHCLFVVLPFQGYRKASIPPNLCVSVRGRLRGEELLWARLTPVCSSTEHIGSSMATLPALCVSRAPRV